MKRLLLSLAAASLLASCAQEGKGPSPTPEPPKPEGLVLMEQHCQSCHALPGAQELDKKTWQSYILVRMAAYMGVFWDGKQYYDSLPARWLEPGIGGERVLKAGIYPKSPTITRPVFEKIRDYILSVAPEKTTGPSNLLPIAKGTPRFREVQPLTQKTEYQPLVTAVKIGPKGELYASFLQQDLVQFDKMGTLGPKIAQPSAAVVHLAFHQGRLMATDIGNMVGADTPKGIFMEANGISNLVPLGSTVRLTELQRPVYSAWADLDQDGQEDLVMAEFGNQLGNIVWYKRQQGGRFIRNEIFSNDGALCAIPHDFNGDGKLDIVSLVANADEGIDIWVNQGGGKFERNRIRRFPPTYGSTALELVDWDKDGDMDLLAANGDNADFPPILKANHGIRLYRNEGNLKFSDAFFVGMNGAYGLRARDFDLDGDMDMAAVSFYPDYLGRPEDAFVYFENQGGDSFVSFTVPSVGASRWMVMDAGDTDGDGDEDILLGAFNVKSGDASEATYQKWIQNDVPVLLLENTTR